VIALVVSSAWPRYYASSPFLNLYHAKHPNFDCIQCRPDELSNPELQERINRCDALVVDDVCVQETGFFKHKPILMVGGDPHAHDMKKVEQLEKEYAACHYVLTGAVFSNKLSPPYFYPSEETRAKHVYFPHSVPDADRMPEPVPWKDRKPKVLLSGSMDKAVYPFRAECREMSKRPGSSIEVLNLGNVQHEAYFAALAQYKAAITCNSIFGYAVAKYFEIPWMGTVLMAPEISNEEQQLIGFWHAENCLFLAGPGNLQAVFEILLQDGDHIARKGQKLMMTCHTTYRRLEYIDHLVSRILTGRFVPEDAKNIFLWCRQEAMK
jgi:hypothetical protein